MIYNSAEDMRVCAITLSHIGSNYPCARDPNKGTPTPHNTSSVVIGYPDSSLAFLQLYNWGNKTFFTTFLSISI